MAAARIVRLDTGRTWVRLLAGLGVLVALLAYVLSVTLTTDRTRTEVAGWVFTVLLLAVTGAIAAGGWFATRHRALVLDEGGIAYTSRRRPWHVAWGELAQARVEFGWRRARAGTEWSVRFVLDPADPAAFAPQHPQLRQYRGRFGAQSDGYAMALGPARELIEPLSAGLREFGGEVDGGVVDLGRLPAGLL